MEPQKKRPAIRAFSGLAGSPLSTVTKRPVGRPRTNFKPAAEKRRIQRANKKVKEQIAKLAVQQTVDGKAPSLPWHISDPKTGERHLLQTGGYNPQKVSDVDSARQRKFQSGGKRVAPSGRGPSVEAPDDRFEYEDSFAKRIQYGRDWIKNGPCRAVDKADFYRDAENVYIAETRDGWRCLVPDCGADLFSWRRHAISHLLEDHASFLAAEFKRYFRIRRRQFRDAQKGQIISATSQNQP